MESKKRRTKVVKMSRSAKRVEKLKSCSSPSILDSMDPDENDNVVPSSNCNVSINILDMTTDDDISLHNMSNRKHILKSQTSCFVPLNNYADTVNIPSYYTERKQEEYGTWKHRLRKVACIPLAFLYGIFIVWVVSEFILNKTDRTKLIPNSIGGEGRNRSPQNVCAVLLQSYNDTADVSVNNFAYDIPVVRHQSPFDAVLLRHAADLNYYNQTNVAKPYSSFLIDDKNKTTDQNMTTSISNKNLIFENDSPELYGATTAVVVILGLISYFSRNTRGTMLLILPGLITKHSRKLIFTLILGLLMNGPINSLQYNFQVALHNTGCMHKSITIAACINQREFRFLLKEMKVLHQKTVALVEAADRFKSIYECPNGRDIYGRPCTLPPTRPPSPPFQYVRNGLHDLMRMTAPSWNEIKSQGVIIMARLGRIGHGLNIARKCLTLITIVILIMDAIGYLRSYYTDSSFDNKVIDQTIQRTWKRKNYRILTPLRHWEIRKGYKEKKFTKFTRKEFFKVFQNGISTFLVASFVAGIFITDWLLVDALQYIKDNQTFNINIEGMNENFTRYIDKLHKSSVKSCLIGPQHPIMDNYYLIGLLLIATATSCMLEIYMTRTRAQICNLFYPDREEERADYLHYAISSGRVDRRHNLLLIIRREIERKLRLVRFSPLKRFQNFLCRFMCKCGRRVVCPGCGWRVKSFRNLTFNVEDKEIQAEICKECDRVLSEKGKRLSGNSYV